MNPKLFASLAVLCVSICGCKDDSSTAAKPGNPPPPGSDPLNAPADYLRAVSEGERTAIKVVDTASLTQAIRMFSIENDRNPKDLQELVDEKFIPQIPKLPKGMKFQYDSTTGNIRVVKE